MTDLKLFMVLLGCKPNRRHTEQHDIFFGITPSIKELVPQMKAFWPDSGKLHIDAWREVTLVDGFSVEITGKTGPGVKFKTEKLFFVNLGGYQPDRFEEQHYILLTVKPTLAAATKVAKKHYSFSKTNTAKPFPISTISMVSM